jgi:diketogulonate reductase-like aldo/keto reductase
MYLIHFPISLKFVPFEVHYPPSWVNDAKAPVPRMIEDNVPIIETWRAMEDLV